MLRYLVDGFDISAKNIESTLNLARRYNLQDRANAKVDTAEILSCEDATFDVVAGIDVLHHVDVALAITEVHRVLKPGGVAIFREPVENPIFDRFRNTALMKSIRPNEKSFERHITDDERKLGKQDFIAIAKYFPNFRCENFRMLSRLDVLLPNYASSLERLDRSMSRFKSYSWWRRTSIFILEKEFI